MQNTLTSTCQYKSILAPDKACPHPPLKGDRDKFCIFHSIDYKKDKGAFWKGIQDKLEKKDFDFTGYYFPPGLEADFRGKEFKDAKFSHATFKGDVDFSGAEFSGESTDFLRAEFSGKNTVFSRAEFSGGSTRFIGAKFSGKGTHFFRAKFLGESTDFLRAGFSGESTYFSLAEFSGESTNFSWATFSGKDTYFSGAEFSGESTDFSGAKFSGGITSFNHADFFGCGTVRFVDTVLEGECKFLGVKFPLRSDQFIIFVGTREPIDLGNTVFLYSNYDRLTFRNCKFIERADEQFRFWRRRVILKDEEFVGKMLELKKEERGGKGAERGAVTEVKEEEIAESVKVEYSHVESLYRQFKKNLEAEKDWELAGEFHYGEMECKRKGITSQWPALAWARQNLGLLAWYKYFSGYGERPFRTFCWIVFLLPVFAGIYWFLDTLPRQDFVYYLWELSVKAAFLQRIGETGNEPIRALGKFFYLLQSVLCPTLIALFILALRRRVRR